MPGQKRATEATGGRLEKSYPVAMHALMPRISGNPRQLNGVRFLIGTEVFLLPQIALICRLEAVWHFDRALHPGSGEPLHDYNLTVSNRGKETAFECTTTATLGEADILLVLQDIVRDLKLLAEQSPRQKFSGFSAARKAEGHVPFDSLMAEFRALVKAEKQMRSVLRTDKNWDDLLHSPLVDR